MLQQHSIVSFISDPAFLTGKSPFRTLFPPSALHTARETSHRDSPRLLASWFTTQRWINSSERCFPNTQAEFKVSFGFFFLAGYSLCSRETEWNVLSGGLPVSCSMGLRGDLWLFTQVLIKFGFQETRIRVVLHQAVHPLLRCGEAATCSLLDILGNQSFCLKVYVYLFGSFLLDEVGVYFPCFWGQFLWWFGFLEVFASQPEFNIFFTELGL